MVFWGGVGGSKLGLILLSRLPPAQTHHVSLSRLAEISSSQLLSLPFLHGCNPAAVLNNRDALLHALLLQDPIFGAIVGRGPQGQKWIYQFRGSPIPNVPHPIRGKSKSNQFLPGGSIYQFPACHNQDKVNPIIFSFYKTWAPESRDIGTSRAPPLVWLQGCGFSARAAASLHR